jgi:hypothetical protein
MESMGPPDGEFGVGKLPGEVSVLTTAGGGEARVVSWTSWLVGTCMREQERHDRSHRSERTRDQEG